MNPVSALASLPSTEPAARPAAPPAEDRDLWDRIWGKEGFSFGALLDIINPLQHIPVVSTIYRSVTGDTIGPGPRIAGGAIFGGVVGLIASVADSAVEAVTGKDTGSHVLAMLPASETEPVSQWASNEQRGQRPQMAGLMNVPDGGAMFADAGETTASRASSAPADSASATASTEAIRTDSAESGTTTPVAADVSKPNTAPGTAANQTMNHAFAPPPRTAQNGAGGRLVPLSTAGRAQGTTPVALPAPQAVAADPALLRELRQGGAAAATAAQKNSGRIDTAIKGHGIVAQGAAATTPVHGPLGAASWLDYATSDPQAVTFDAEAKKSGKNRRPPSDASAIPEVTPDFLMKMQQALDKYQSMRASTPPSVDLSR